jgi:DNA-binding response OmpR family regulator
LTPRHVLIVEDDATLLRGLRDKFESQGYRVSAAADGDAGLRAALADRFDLILLDVMLPRRNGFEVCLELRRNRVASPILMLTAKAQEGDIVHGLELGADDYVTKPFRIRELLARVQALLRRVEGPGERVVCFGEFRLDREARKLWRGNKETPLTGKEYGVLEYLVRHEGRAVTRHQLLDAVWGRTALVTPRSIDRCITTLRSKIEPDSRQPAYIQTLRDVGYRFERGQPLESQ